MTVGRWEKENRSSIVISSPNPFSKMNIQITFQESDCKTVTNSKGNETISKLDTVHFSTKNTSCMCDITLESHLRILPNSFLNVPLKHLQHTPPFPGVYFMFQHKIPVPYALLKVEKCCNDLTTFQVEYILHFTSFWPPPHWERKRQLSI